jgi:serine/threonine protein kinase
VTVSSGDSSPGTLAYMAPEQIQGQPVTPANDLWALGAVLYEMVTGHRPFEGDYAQALAYAIVNETQPPRRCTRRSPVSKQSWIECARVRSGREGGGCRPPRRKR